MSKITATGSRRVWAWCLILPAPADGDIRREFAELPAAHGARKPILGWSKLRAVCQNMKAYTR